MAGFSKLPTKDDVLSRVQDQLVVLLPGTSPNNPDLFTAITDESILPGYGVYFSGSAVMPGGVIVPRVGIAHANKPALLPCVGVSVEGVDRNQPIRIRWTGLLSEVSTVTTGGAIGGSIYLQDNGLLAAAVGSTTVIVGSILDIDTQGRVWIKVP